MGVTKTTIVVTGYIALSLMFNKVGVNSPELPGSPCFKYLECDQFFSTRHHRRRSLGFSDAGVHQVSTRQHLRNELRRRQLAAAEPARRPDRVLPRKCSVWDILFEFYSVRMFSVWWRPFFLSEMLLHFKI